MLVMDVRDTDNRDNRANEQLSDKPTWPQVHKWPGKHEGWECITILVNEWLVCYILAGYVKPVK